MKNNYTISPNYLLQLENDELRERIKKLVADFNQLKKLIEEIKKQEVEVDNDKIF
jgi:regulator of replication initiation timing